MNGSLPGFSLPLLVAGNRVDGGVQGKADWGLEAWRAYMRCRASDLGLGARFRACIRGRDDYDAYYCTF